MFSRYLMILSVCLLFAFPSAADETTQLPHVVVVTTGGTIAMKYDSTTGGAVPAVSGADLIEAVPGLDSIATIETVEFSNIDSSQMTPEMWRHLSGEVQDILNRSDVSGVVITHGTDTMAEAAFFLVTTLRASKPVVFVGSMRSGSDLSPDGPANLYNAVLQAGHPDAADWGVTVTMNQYICGARHVVKDQTTNIQTFDCGEYGYLGYITDGHIISFNTVVEDVWLPLPDTLANVALLLSYAGDDGSMIRHAVDTGADGLVVVGVGAGNLNEEAFQAVRYALDQGIPVVAGSRVRHGDAEPLYGDEGGGSSLVEAGVILSGSIDPYKARLLLMIALAQPGMDTATLRSLFIP